MSEALKELKELYDDIDACVESIDGYEELCNDYKNKYKHLPSEAIKIMDNIESIVSEIRDLEGGFERQKDKIDSLIDELENN